MTRSAIVLWNNLLIFKLVLEHIKFNYFKYKDFPDKQTDIFSLKLLFEKPAYS